MTTALFHVALILVIVLLVIAAAVLYIYGKQILCAIIFKGRHDFTPWTAWIRHDGAIKFRYCQFCGLEEVKK
jgi:hypothetical protein